MGGITTYTYTVCIKSNLRYQTHMPVFTYHIFDLSHFNTFWVDCMF